MTREQYHNMLAELDTEALRGILNRVQIAHPKLKPVAEEYVAKLPSVKGRPVPASDAGYV